MFDVLELAELGRELGRLRTELRRRDAMLARELLDRRQALLDELLARRVDVEVVEVAGELARGFVYSESRVWNIIFGLIGIAAGIIILVNPKVGAVTLVWIVSISLILRGIVAIALGAAVRRLQQG